MWKLISCTLGGIAVMFAIARLSFFFIPVSDGPKPPVAVASKASASGSEEMVIQRDDSGQFYLNAQANGRETRFLVDTGADFVALTIDEAESLDLDVDRANFQAITKTASGVGMGQHVMIDRLRVGEREFNNVDAVVVDGLETNLLGQSILSKFGSVEMRENELVIHHEA
jgi:aspartyl protease family protein